MGWIKCPKCGKANLRAAMDECRAEHKGGSFLDSVEVLKCDVCGFRRYPETAVVMPLTEKIRAKNQHQTGHTRADIMDLVKRYYPSIKSLRTGKKPASWCSIERLIRQATGFAITDATLAKYYDIITKEQQDESGIA